MYKLRESFALGLLGKEIDSNFRIKPHTNSEQAKECICKEIINRDVKINTNNLKLPENIKIVKSACFSCNSTCEVLVYVDKKTEKVLKIEGDPESPITKGILCTKGLAAKDLVENPERLKYPMKRKGKRGSGQWERISWDEALTSVAANLEKYKDKYGPQGIALLEGTRRGWSRVYTRFANAFGIVNHGAAGWAQCLWPRLVDCQVTFGKPYTETCDFENTSCILNWGVNPPATWPVNAANIMDARQRGAVLIVVDPYMSHTASKADLWLQLLPGTDTALALTMLNVIIEEEIYDKDFVKKWTVGFEKLKQHVKKYSPEWGEKVTRVPAELIIKASRIYASYKPACINRCVALDGIHDSVQACRAVSLLAAITGNIGIKGGNVLTSNRGEISQNTHEFIAYNQLNPKDIPLRRGFEEFPLLCDKLCPVPSAHMPTLWETIVTENPYPIKAALIFGSNALISYSNTNRVSQAIDNLDFLVVADLFMTPTAQMADIVLPASSWLERDNLISSFQSSSTYTITQQKVITFNEARSDIDIICDLANKLGLKQYFWDNAESMYNFLLEPTGYTFKEYKKMKRVFAPLRFKQYEKEGFKTPSGKIELYSSLLEKNNCAPLPPYIHPLGKQVEGTKYHYVLTTGGRVPVYRHTENRQNKLLKEICSKSVVLIYPDTALKHGINNGESMIVETETGWAKGYAFYTLGLHPDVIQVAPGWSGEENINRVIPWGKYAEGIGTVPMRGILCAIRKDYSEENIPKENERES